MSKRSRARDRRTPHGESERKVAPRVLAAPHPLLASIALLLVVAGARWWLVGTYGVDVPWLDQWDAEAQESYRAWRSGTLTASDLVAPHNEHRIFFTRALALGLLSVNGQWDPRLQMVVNALLFALILAGVFLLLRKGRSGGFQMFCWVLLALLGSAPYASTNTLLGFQSQFYFLVGFSLPAIYALVNSRPASAPWFAAVACGSAALLSMASGQAAALAAIAVLLASAIRSGTGFRQALRRDSVSFAAAAVLVAAGVALRHTPAHHADLAAKSVGDFARFLLACLSWPGKPMIALAVVAWMPFAAFVSNYLRGRGSDDAAARFVLGVGVWTLLQAVALAVFRANSGEGLESRYTDILAFGMLANAICAVWLIGSGGRLRPLMPVLACVWFAAAGVGLVNASSSDNAASWKRDMEIRRAATAGFVATGDERYLNSAPPHPDARRVAAVLQDPDLRTILPAGIAKPLELVPRSGSPAPQMVEGWSTPDLRNVGTGVWAVPGPFWRYAVVPPSTKFEYRVSRKTRLPFLLLHFIGNSDQVSVADSAGSRRAIVSLPSGSGRGRHVFVRCPAAECVLTGSSGASQLAFSEPKEIGGLSVAALLAVLWGKLVALAGGILFVAAVAVEHMRLRKRQPALTAV